MTNTSEPTSLIAGYSYSWTKTLSDYSSALYSLTYVLRNAITGQSTSVTATIAGPFSYSVAFVPALTEGLAPGQYLLIGYITDDLTGGQATKVSVYNSTLDLQANPLITAGDLRSHARRMVDLLRSMIEKLAKGTISSSTVNGKQYTQKDMAAARAELARYEELLRQEEAAARLESSAGKVFIRFTPTGI